MTEIKCKVCKKVLDGVFLSLKRGRTYESFSPTDIKNINAKFAFECGHNGCSAVVCQECISQLKKEKRGGFLIQRERPICPKCKEAFGAGGSRVLVTGRFSQGVHTYKEEVGPGKGKMFFYDEQKVNFTTYRGNDAVSRILSHDITMLPNVCSMCMSTPVYIRSEPGKIILPLCKACHDLLHHPAIENPTPPTRFGGQDAGSIAMAYINFINPEYAELIEDIIKHR